MRTLEWSKLLMVTEIRQMEQSSNHRKLTSKIGVFVRIFLLSKSDEWWRHHYKVFWLFTCCTYTNISIVVKTKDWKKYVHIDMYISSSTWLHYRKESLSSWCLYKSPICLITNHGINYSNLMYLLTISVLYLLIGNWYVENNIYNSISKTNKNRSKTRRN